MVDQNIPCRVLRIEISYGLLGEGSFLCVLSIVDIGDESEYVVDDIQD